MHSKNPASTGFFLCHKFLNLMHIYIIHENDAWVEPLRKELQAIGAPFTEWFIDELQLDLGSIPPYGIFYNRMSASSHTRGHRYAVEATRGLMAWLTSHGRRVVNDRRAIGLEVSKVEQIIGLQAYGIRVPHTVAATGAGAFKKAAARWTFPYIVKPNRGGKGAGVELVRSEEDLLRLVATFDDLTLDGTVLIQQYVKPENGRITRHEFIGGKFYYAVHVDASGGFELCPADSCQVGEAFCPVGDNEGELNSEAGEKFEVDMDYTFEERARCEAYLAASGMEVAAMESVRDADGILRFYDVNINTNYNAAAEKRATKVVGRPVSGMGKLAQFLEIERNQLNVTWAQKRAS
jgi:hypothetical protein